MVADSVTEVLPFAEAKQRIEGLTAFQRDRYRVLGYTTDMADLMRTATLFIGCSSGREGLIAGTAS